MERVILIETNVPSYSFKKISIDISGPFTETSRGNLYIVSFVNWVEGYQVKDKIAQIVANLLINEIFSRFGAPLESVTDNELENLNQIMRNILESLNVSRITTYPYHSQ